MRLFSLGKLFCDLFLLLFFRNVREKRGRKGVEGSIPTCACFHLENFFVTFIFESSSFARVSCFLMLLWDLKDTVPLSQCYISVS